MNDERTVRTSRLLSLALRHQPDVLGLALDEAGWVAVVDLLRGLAAHGEPCSQAELEWVVESSPKQRFALSADGLRIRANQGHSVAVELGLEPREPPEVLFHGTSRAVLPAIRCEGLRRGTQTHVHLSADEGTANVVARRRAGAIVILRIRARALHQIGQTFYRSENGVWLTTHVPPDYLQPD